MSDMLHILLVDDDAQIRLMGGTLLRQEFPGARIDEVDGPDGLHRLLEAGGVSLVLTDYQLGWTDGLTVLREVKRRDPDCPVIMFTATGSEEIAVEAMKAGLDDYVLKSPKHIGRLPAAIRLALEQAARRRSLKETEARYRSLLDVLDTSAVAVLILDAAWTVLWANAAFERYFGLPRDRVIGRDKRQLLRDAIGSLVDHPADFPARILRTYEDRHCVESFACHIPAGEGREERWLEHRSLPILAGSYAGGRIEHYYDITERTRAEAALREEHRRLEAILETASDGIHILDKAGNVLLANRAFRDMLGYTEAEAARLNVADWDVQWTREELQARFAQLTGRQRFETRHRRRDGSILDVEVSAALVEIGGETFWYAASRDITERKQAEERLRKSEERFKTIFEQAPLGIALIDSLTGHIYAVNAKFARIAGRTVEDMTRIDWMSITHPDDVQEDLDNMARLNAGEIPGFQMEKRYLLPDGGAVWINMTIAPVTVGDKAHPRHLCMIEDITDRKRTETRLTDALRQQDLLMASLPVVVYRARPDGRYGATWVSDSVTKVAGFTPDCFTGDLAFWLARVHPEDRERVLRDTEAGLSRGAYAHEYRWRCADETYHWFADRAVVVDRPDGQTQEFVGIWLDISAQKRNETALREASDRFNSVMAASPIAITVLDLEGRVQLWNPAAQALFQWSEVELIGHPLPTVPSDKLAEHRAIRERALRGEIVQDLEVIRRRKDGSLVTISLSIVLLRDAAGAPQGFLGMMEDVTERKQMEAQAMRIERIAAFGQLLGGIAHEIKNPLFVATGYLQLIREKLARREFERVMPNVQAVEAAMKRIARTTQEFLDLAKPAKPRIESCQVSVLLGAALAFLANELMRNQIRVETAIAPELPSIQADPKRLQEAFQNLMMNAMQAMAETHGRGTLTVSASLAASPRLPVSASADTGHGDTETRGRGDTESAASPPLRVAASAVEGQGEGEKWIEVKIQDDGPGILPEHRAKLFEPFFSTKPPEQGTGLGLWMVRMTVMAIGGAVTCESDVGHGATFIVRLPVGAAPPQPAVPESGPVRD